MMKTTRVDRLIDKYGEYDGDVRILILSVIFVRDGRGKISLSASSDNEDYFVDIEDRKNAFQKIPNAVSNLILKMEEGMKDE